MNADLTQKFNQILENSSEKDQQVLEILLDGLVRKQTKQNGSYLGGILGSTSRLTDDKQYEMIIPNTDLIQNSLDIVHGGITATLLDSAMGSLVHYHLPEGQAAVTSEMKINYVAPGKGLELRCVANIIHQGSKIVVTEGKVFRDDGKLIAHATGSFFIITKR
ncbi:PaaI family thioesterase [Cytobacillus suaedae]|nr:PaaI family thioesterase [Cytobacillus suaedae]